LDHVLIAAGIDDSLLSVFSLKEWLERISLPVVVSWALERH
jgi:hypothetical protein